VLAWTRGEQVLAAVNFGAEPAPLPAAGTLLLSTNADRPAGARELGAYEAVLLDLASA
jgi:hypothetical protein